MIGRRAGPALAALALALGAGGCTILNGSDACETHTGEIRVNARGDDLEHLGSARSAAVVADGRTIVAHVSSTADGTASEVRVSLLEPGTGTANILCGSDLTERVVSAPGTIAFRASAAAVQIPDPSDPLGHVAVAAVGWTSVPDLDGDPGVSVLLLDDGGCDVGVTFPPVLAEQTGPVQGLALAWSEARGALYAVFHDGRQILGAWIEAPGSTSEVAVLASEDQIVGDLALAFAPDGRGLVAWQYAELGWLGRGEVAVHAALLDADGALRPASLAGGAAAPFRVDDGPSFTWQGHLVALTVAVDATADRSAIAFETSAAADQPPRIHVLELDTADGAPRHAGLRDPSPGDEGAHASPSLRYLPDGALLTLWESAASDGTMARVYGEDGAPRFTGVGCDAGAFAVGARDALLPGSSTALVSGDDLWIFHAGDAPDDPVGTAALGWHVPLAELWPAN